MLFGGEDMGIKKIIFVLALAVAMAVGFNMTQAVKADEIPSTQQETETTTEEATTEEATTEEETTEQPEEEEEIEDDSEMFRLIAHRGFSGVAPENSMPAFQKAVEAGFKYIEFDIYRTKEDAEGHAEWVISHDDNLERLFGVKKDIKDLTYDQIKQYKYIGGKNVDLYPNTHIATLQELIDYMAEVKAMGIKVMWKLELKTLANTSEMQYFEEEIVNPLKIAGVYNNIKFISFHYSYLKKMREIDSSAKVGFLAKIMDEDYLEYARKCNADEIVFKGTNDNTKPEYIKQAQDEGFKLGVYEIDTPVIMGAYYKQGVNIFTTNEVDPADVSVQLLLREYSVKDFTYALSKKEYTFSNTRKKPAVTVEYDGHELVKGVNYDVSYVDNKNPGTAKCVVSGINNCTNEKEIKYTIKMPKVKDFAITDVTSDSVTLNWTPNTSVTGYKIYQYNYTTKKYTCIKKVPEGTYAPVKIAVPSSSKVRFRMRTYFTENKKTYTSDPCSGKTVYSYPKKSSIKKLKRSKKGASMTVTMKSNPNVTGYRIVRATNKNFTLGVRTTTLTKKNSVKISGLVKKKAYYVKARAYLKVGSKYYYGKYSAVKKIKGVKAKKKKKKKKKKN